MEPLEFRYEDEKVICKVCGAVFYISPSEQLRWSENGLHLPKRCPSCRRHGRHASPPTDKSKFDYADFKRVLADAKNAIAKYKL